MSPDVELDIDTIDDSGQIHSWFWDKTPPFIVQELPPLGFKPDVVLFVPHQHVTAMRQALRNVAGQVKTTLTGADHLVVAWRFAAS